MYPRRSIIASWINEDRTRAAWLQANGELLTLERDHPSDMWPPATKVGKLESSVPEFTSLMEGMCDA